MDSWAGQAWLAGDGIERHDWRPGAVGCRAGPLVEKVGKAIQAHSRLLANGIDMSLPSWSLASNQAVRM